MEPNRTYGLSCSLPFDFVKTRIQKMEKGPDGKYPYKGPVDCAVQTFTKEGPLKFYTGFPTYCVRYALAATVEAESSARECRLPVAFWNWMAMLFFGDLARCSGVDRLIFLVDSR